jgi:ATP-binding cassette, subfamily C (CFTR/MRP), member 1
MMVTIQQWLVLVLDMLVAGLAILVISLAVAFRNTTTGGQIGIALNVILVVNTTLVRLMEQWTNLETSLGAVARVKTIESVLLPEDKEGEDGTVSEEWPKSGAIEFRDVTASYKYVDRFPPPFHSKLTLSSPEAIALKGISLRILPGQKVGICGRTGR